MKLRAFSFALGLVVCACYNQANSPVAAEPALIPPPAPAASASAPIPPLPTGAAPASATPAPATVTTAGANAAPWWNIPYPDRFDAKSLKVRQAVIRVKGNQFVTESGAPVVFQGVNIADPDKLARDGHFDRRHFEMAKSFGANIVRVPVHPAALRGRGKAEYFKLLDQAIQWANELELYLIIDWHSIGNLAAGLFQHPMYDTTKQETFEFWRSVAYRYRDVATVAFYEIFNEPTLYKGTLGSATWEEWRDINEQIIDLIFAHDKRVIPLVGGFDWAYDLRPVARAPIRRAGIGYVSHPYPQKTTAPFEQNWDKDYGFVAAKYPLFATEIGFMHPDEPGAHIPAQGDETYGKQITEYLAKKGASWTAWCFDPEWGPPLISDWNYTPTDAGKYFRQVMLERPKPAQNSAPPTPKQPAAHQQPAATAPPNPH